MIVVYTAIFGGRDTLKNAPRGADRCVCFTDDARLTKQGWEIWTWKSGDRPRRTSRLLLCEADRLFPEAEATVWLDASCEFIDYPAFITEASLHDMAGCAHPSRTSCYQEGEAVVRLGLARADVIARQMATYRREGFQPTQLTWGGLLWRRNTEGVARFNRRWFKEVERYSDRNQVSIDYTAWTVGLKIAHLRGHAYVNPYIRYGKHTGGSRCLTSR